MSQNDLMTEIAEIITDMRRIEYDPNDSMRHCKSELKRLVGTILADAAIQARDALLIVERIKYEQARAETDAPLEKANDPSAS